MYKWKVSFSGKSGVSAKDFLTRLEECRGFTPVNDDDLLRALPLLLQDIALQWFRIRKNRWRSWSEFRADFRRRFGYYDFASRVREKISSRSQGPKEKVDDCLTQLEGLIAMLKDEVLLVEQLDWAYRGLRPNFRKVMQRNDFRDFHELAQKGRRWKKTWAAAKEYRPPPPPESSFLPDFAYRSETASAAHKRTPVSAVTETKTPPRNSGEPSLGNRNTVERKDENESKSRDNGHQPTFVREMLKKNKESNVKKNFRSTGSDLKVGGGHRRPSTSAEKAPKDSGA